MQLSAFPRCLAVVTTGLLLSTCPAAFAQATTPKAAAKPAAKAPANPKPTLADVPYGKHPKQVMDFWRAESAQPTPLLFYIHGGGWTAGSKNFVYVAPYLKAGISVVSIEYRFIGEALAEGIKPPVYAPLHDAARALQFVRSKAAEWNIDKRRIGASGGSAGACSSLWLAFHPDMADPKSADPVARESTRLLCAAVNGPQTSLDPKQMREWMPNSRYGGHAFGFRSFQEFFDGREKILPWIKEYSPYELVTSDDPPVYCFFGAAPAMGQVQKDPTHSANFGVKLQEKCRSVGVTCDVVYPGAPDVKYRSTADYMIAMLKAAK